MSRQKERTFMSEKDRAFVEKQFDDLADEYEGNLTELLAPYGGGVRNPKVCRV